MFRWYDHVIMDDASVVKRMGLASDRGVNGLIV